MWVEGQFYGMLISLENILFLFLGRIRALTMRLSGPLRGRHLENEAPRFSENSIRPSLILWEPFTGSVPFRTAVQIRTDSKFVNSAVSNSYTVNKRPLKELCAPLATRILIADSCTRWRGSFKELSQDEGRADFSKNLRYSLFHKYLSNELSFSRIHLA